MITADKLIKKLKWAIQYARNNNKDSISCGKIEEYILEHIAEERNLVDDMFEDSKKNNKKNGGVYAKDSVVDFIIDID
jgi:hypothetical protein